ncbi:hypothetical protein HanPI659440_Chr00c01g0705021 [Helianthus annuus]|nr:hypothetical protein HanPI659440_Chr00c01g0704991 [Helianthus annuus]KAJ0818665.1 hypothetical protein HanPI659440_Chr00c01g0705021 [Helianthus annuus]
MFLFLLVLGFIWFYLVYRIGLGLKFRFCTVVCQIVIFRGRAGLRNWYVLPVLCGRWLHILFVKGLPHFLLVMKLCFLVYNL